jgi:putative Holliday junction resolvase
MENLFMRIVGIDYGDARTGIAVCDINEIIATAITTVKAGGLTEMASKCSEEIKKLNAELIVLGLPKNMDGSESFRAEKTKLFAEKLKENINLDIVFFDERLTTVSAYNYLNQTNYNKNKKKNVIDALSAQIILQDYIDMKRNKINQKSN